MVGLKVVATGRLLIERARLPRQGQIEMDRGWHARAMIERKLMRLVARIWFEHGLQVIESEGERGMCVL